MIDDKWIRKGVEWSSCDIIEIPRMKFLVRIAGVPAEIQTEHFRVQVWGITVMGQLHFYWCIRWGCEPLLYSNYTWIWTQWYSCGIFLCIITFIRLHLIKEWKPFLRYIDTHTHVFRMLHRSFFRILHFSSSTFHNSLYYLLHWMSVQNYNYYAVFVRIWIIIEAMVLIFVEVDQREG